MIGYGYEMRAYRPPESGLPFGVALVWAVVDLHLAFGFRLAQLALETPLDWCNASRATDVRESEDNHD